MTNMEVPLEVKIIGLMICGFLVFLLAAYDKLGQWIKRFAKVLFKPQFLRSTQAGKDLSRAGKKALKAEPKSDRAKAA